MRIIYTQKQTLTVLRNKLFKQFLEFHFVYRHSKFREFANINFLEDAWL